MVPGVAVNVTLYTRGVTVTEEVSLAGLGSYWSSAVIEAVLVWLPPEFTTAWKVKLTDAPEASSFCVHVKVGAPVSLLESPPAMEPAT